MTRRRNLSFLNMDWHTDWDAFFGVKRPIILEIGFGNAEYLIHLAKQNPNHHVIGIEISQVSLDKAERKIRNNKIDNACAIHSKGESALYCLFQPNSIEQIHVNYPDPWFKDRHAGRRLIQRDTLDLMTNRMVEGGLFFLGTDILEYAEMSHELLVDTPQLTNELDAPWQDEMANRIVTKYEEKGYREGRPGHFFRYRRNATPAIDYPVYRELPMPNIVLKTPMSMSEIVKRVETRISRSEGDVHVSIMDGYLNGRENVLLFEMHIDEPELDMHTAIMLFPRKEANTYTVRYNTLGYPRPTLGMHRATAFLADWVVSLHPDAEILDSKVRKY